MPSRFASLWSLLTGGAKKKGPPKEDIFKPRLPQVSYRPGGSRAPHTYAESCVDIFQESAGFESSFDGRFDTSIGSLHQDSISDWPRQVTGATFRPAIVKSQSVGGLNSRSSGAGGGRVCHAKRVAPPTVPESSSSSSSSSAHHRHSGS